VAAPRARPSLGADVAFALLAGAAWFALTTLLAAATPHTSLAAATATIIVAVGVVIALGHYLEVVYAVTVGVASAVAVDWYFIPPTHQATWPDLRNSVALSIYLFMAGLIGGIAMRDKRRAMASEVARRELEGGQAALRRIATLVARGTPPSEVFASVAREAGILLEFDIAVLVRLEADGTATVIGAWRRSGGTVEVGSRWNLDGDNVAAAAVMTRQSARAQHGDSDVGPVAEALKRAGTRWSVGYPIMVSNKVWGVLVAATAAPDPISDAEVYRLGEFTELTATAIGNAQARSELDASRARMVAAADEARRLIERDLHDGVQQRLVSLALQLKLANDLIDQSSELGVQLSEVQEGLLGAVESLRELAHGIHPAILSEGGLGPALSMLARRSAIPVELDVDAPGRLPEAVEVAAYYVVSEALTNVGKYSRSSSARVSLISNDADIRLIIEDDGVGGADQRNGSGLVGLEDRVNALGGTLQVVSPRGAGTRLEAFIPLTVTSDPTALSY
jgi:signal transduction histidine kinase